MIRRLAALCAAAAVCFAVASCSSSSDKPSAQASIGSSIPSYATSNDQHGAQEFASYWVDTLNKATVSGKTAQLKALSDKGCARCNDFLKQLDKMYAAGGHVVTKGWAVQAMVPETGLPKNVAAVKVAVKVAPQTVYRSSKAQPEKVKGGPMTFRLVMGRQGDHWIVQNIDL